MEGLTSRGVHVNKVKERDLVGLMVVQCAKEWMPTAAETNKLFGGSFGGLCFVWTPGCDCCGGRWRCGCVDDGGAWWWWGWGADTLC